MTQASPTLMSDDVDVVTGVAAAAGVRGRGSARRDLSRAIGRPAALRRGRDAARPRHARARAVPASFTAASQLVEVHTIDDADDRRVDGRGLAAQRLAGGAAFDDDQHFLADAGADRVDRQERRRRAAGRRASSGCTSSSFAPSSLRASAWRRRVPTTRPICMASASDSRSQRSTMPTTQASTGGSAGRNGNDASLPRTKNTCSPTPAPHGVDRDERAADGLRDRAQSAGARAACARPALASLIVATTSPTDARDLHQASRPVDVDRDR